MTTNNPNTESFTTVKLTRENFAAFLKTAQNVLPQDELEKVRFCYTLAMAAPEHRQGIINNWQGLDEDYKKWARDLKEIEYHGMQAKDGTIAASMGQYSFVEGTENAKMYPGGWLGYTCVPDAFREQGEQLLKLMMTNAGNSGHKTLCMGMLNNEPAALSEMFQRLGFTEETFSGVPGFKGVRTKGLEAPSEPGPRVQWSAPKNQL